MSSDVRLLHTRRIGAPAMRPETPDDVALVTEGLGRPADLQGAVKATGQRGSLRYGFLGVMEDDARFDAFHGDEPLTIGQAGRDFGVLRMLYEHANGGYRALGFMSTAMRHPQRSASVHSVDGQFITRSGRLRTSGQLIASDVEGSLEDGVGGVMDLSYTPRQGLSHYLSLDAFDDAIQINDMGYLRRNDYRRVAYRMRFSKPNMSLFRNMRTYVRMDRMWNTAGKIVDSQLSFDQRVTLHNLSQLRMSGGVRPAHYDDRGSFGNGPVSPRRHLGVGAALLLGFVQTIGLLRAPGVAQRAHRRRHLPAHAGISALAAHGSDDHGRGPALRRSRSLAAAPVEWRVHYLRLGRADAECRLQLLLHRSPATAHGLPVGGRASGGAGFLPRAGPARIPRAARQERRGSQRRLRHLAHERAAALSVGDRAAVGPVRGLHAQCRDAVCRRG